MATHDVTLEEERILRFLSIARFQLSTFPEEDDGLTPLPVASLPGQDLHVDAKSVLPVLDWLEREIKEEG